MGRAMAQETRYHQMFESANGRFLLVLLVNTSDAKLQKLQLVLTDGNNVWKAKSCFEEACGTVGSRDDNVKYLIKRIKNSELETTDKEKPSLSLLPPGKPCQLDFIKSSSDTVAGERLNLMLSLANSSEVKAHVEQEELLSVPTHKKSRLAKMPAQSKVGMSLLNPGSKKITKDRGVDFD